MTIRRKEKKKESSSGTSLISRDKIGVEQLQSLKERFEDDLNEQEFVNLFHEIVDPNLNETKLSHLFQKIDANSDGTVDWDEFTNFMFLESVDKFAGEADDTEVHYEASDVKLVSGEHHREAITKILRIEKSHQYLTSSKDGTVRAWSNTSFKPQGTVIRTSKWITDMLHLPLHNRLVCASMDRRLTFYDLPTKLNSTSSSLVPLGHISDTSSAQATPLCLGYAQLSNFTEIIVSGTDTGVVNVYKTSDEIFRNADHTGIHHTAKLHLHSDWLTSVAYVPDIASVVASSLDTNISVIDLERMVRSFEYKQHTKAVYDFCYSNRKRLVASCGIEREVSIWNPYSCNRAVATLRGHTSSVSHVTCDDDNYQLVSVSSDNEFKVWDLRTYQCLQTFSSSNSSTTTSSILFDSTSETLVTGSTFLSAFPLHDGPPSVAMTEKETTGAEEEDTQVSNVLACYNPAFNQVVISGKEDDGVGGSSVQTYSVESGELISKFTQPHGSTDVVTAMQFDSPGRRLLTGSHDGSALHMWNFSNGSKVKVFHSSSSKKPAKSKSYNVATRGCVTLDHGILKKSRKNNVSMIESLPKMLQKKKKIENPQAVLKNNDDDNSACIQKEVTCILDIERHDHVKGGGGNHAGSGDSKRYVCSAGWDQRVTVWVDTKDESEVSPLFKFPHQHCDKKHTRDIVSMVFIPPSYIATLGLDGKVLLWSLNSGDFIHTIYETVETNSVEGILYNNKLEMILILRSDGLVLIFDRNLDGIVDVRLRTGDDTTTSSIMCCVACDDAADYLVTGDSAGSIHTWSITGTSNNTGFNIQNLCEWPINSTSSAIDQVQFVQAARQVSTYLLVTSRQQVSLWTLDGIPIGVFNSEVWDLNATVKNPSCVNETTKTTLCSYYIPSSSSNKNLTKILSEESLPKMGEVWINVPKFRKRVMMEIDKTSGGTGRRKSVIVSRKMSPSEATECISNGFITPADIVELVTISRVGKGEVMVWDYTMTVVRRTLEEFNSGWMKHNHLSQYIGRKFEDKKTFKVLGIKLLKDPEAAFKLVDTNGVCHAIQPLNKCVTVGSKPTQHIVANTRLSLYKTATTTIAAANRDRKVVAGSGLLTDPTTETSFSKLQVSQKAKRLEEFMIQHPELSPRPEPFKIELPHRPRTQKSVGRSGVAPTRSLLRLSHEPHSKASDLRKVYYPSELPFKEHKRKKKKNNNQKDGVVVSSITDRMASIL